MSVRATKPGQERTPLHCAVTEGHADLAQLLISKGADVNVADERGMTALHWAAHYGRQDLLEMLCAGHADVEARDSDGKSPI